MSGYHIATLKPDAAPARNTLHAPPVRAGLARSGNAGNLGWYLRFHALCLILYSFFGKGFAYLGTGSFYVSEVLLGLGLLAMAGSRRFVLLFRSPIGLAMLPFLLWQIVCTVPYFADYGIYVARDAVLWGYAAFAWIIATLIASSPQRIEAFVGRYKRFAPWFLMIGPLAALITVFLSSRLPVWPGTDVPIVAVKLDEFEAHLAGIAAFVVTGLSATNWWLSFVGLEVLIGAPNRGGLVGFGLAFVVASILARRPRALLLPAIALVALFLAAVLDIHVSVEGGAREFSASQLLDGLDSTVSTDVNTGDLENTRDWRLEWWRTIWDYTVTGPYFWTGKGYGINLASDDGFQTEGDLLRSPHNSHLTFLARSGVPGFVLWNALQLTWLATMLASYLRARRSAKPRWSGLFAWLISYWVAFVVAGSFDVFLENPMAAVPFWTIFGAGWGSQLVFARYRTGADFGGIKTK